MKEQEFEGYIDSCALAILSEEVVGISDHGAIPEIFKNKRQAVKWALERVQYRHAWVVCGPVSGMKEFLEKMDKDSRFGVWENTINKGGKDVKVLSYRNAQLSRRPVYW